MPLLKDGDLIADPWTRWQPETGDDSADLPAGPLLLDLETWRHHRDRLTARRDPLGLWLSSDDDIDDFAPEDLARLSLIVLHLPRFTDGRPYSTARILRGRLGYRGALRASGNILRDQLFFLQRCGIDEFDLPETAPVAAWRRAFGELSAVYQPASDRRQPAHRLRARTTSPAGRGTSVDVAAAPREAAALGNAFWAY